MRQQCLVIVLHNLVLTVTIVPLPHHVRGRRRPLPILSPPCYFLATGCPLARREVHITSNGGMDERVFGCAVVLCASGIRAPLPHSWLLFL
ncbi:hypothetical protein BC826DRAFT_998403 [Russula brevipes]|nr:hypothetical protein BC826DRAFT_998403 [Russula brevipes]